MTKARHDFVYLADKDIDELSKLAARLERRRKTFHDRLSQAERDFMVLDRELSIIRRLIEHKRVGNPTDKVLP